MQHWKQVAALAVLMMAASAAEATGAATCDAGPKESWQAQEKLAAQLKEKGWQVRRIKVDDSCYEVYAMDEKGKKVESYFHPRTLAPVPRGSKKHKG